MKEHVIETVNLSKKYDGKERVKNLGLKVEKGKIYGLLGPNGAGKTTTMKMLLGLARPSSGHVKIFGETLDDKSRSKILKETGSLIENPNYYAHLSGLENLRIQEILLDLPKGSAENVLKLVGLDKDKDRKVKTYSLGMQQRLGIAAALVRNPKLLILDEPTNGLDPAGIQEMRSLLIRLAKENDVTIMVSSHLLSEIEKIADDVGIIDCGKLIYQGSLEDLQSLKLSETTIDTSDNKSVFKSLEKCNPECTLEGKINLKDFSKQMRAKVARELVERGIDIFEISTSEPDLEELFLSLTQGENDEHLS